LYIDSAGYAFALEYALDIVFKNAEALKPIYEEISRQAVLTVRMRPIRPAFLSASTRCSARLVNPLI
jgi:hypothetical protein